MVHSFSILLFLIFDTQHIGHLLIRKATEINRLKLWKDSVRLDHPEGIGAGLSFAMVSTDWPSIVRLFNSSLFFQQPQKTGISSFF